jgi:hypothetical protein
LIGHNANGRRHEVSELIAAPADPQDLVEAWWAAADIATIQ